MRSSRTSRHGGKKVTSESPSSSPSSAVLIRPHTRARRAAAVQPSDRGLHTSNCASESTAPMSHVDFHSPPTSPMSSDHHISAHGDSGPHSDETPSTSALSMSALASAAVRRRRKRIAIELPPDQAGQLDKTELKKLKNRIAAARARERTQTQVEELEATVELLWRENQQQQAVIDQLRGLLQSHHQSAYHGAATHLTPVSYQDMLSTDVAFLPPPAYGSTMTTLPPGYPAHSDNHNSDLHAGLVAEFSEMFPAHAGYPLQQQQSP